MRGLIVYGPPPYDPGTRGLKMRKEPDATVASLKERIAEVKANLSMVPAWELELKALEAALKGYTSVRKKPRTKKPKIQKQT